MFLKSTARGPVLCVDKELMDVLSDMIDGHRY